MTIGALIRTIPAPATAANGLAWDFRTFWVVDGATDIIYQINPIDGAIIKSFAVPTASTSGKGLAWDPRSGTFWMVDSNTSEIYQIDADGRLLKTLAAPASSNSGLTHSGQYLYMVANNGSDYLYILDPSDGSIIRQDEIIFDIAPTGIATHEGQIWVTGNNTNMIYQLNANGSVVRSFNAPTNNSQELIFDGHSMWILGVDTIFQVSMS